MRKQHRALAIAKTRGCYGMRYKPCRRIPSRSRTKVGQRARNHLRRSDRIPWYDGRAQWGFGIVPVGRVWQRRQLVCCSVSERSSIVAVVCHREIIVETKPSSCRCSVYRAPQQQSLDQKPRHRPRRLRWGDVGESAVPSKKQDSATVCGWMEGSEDYSNHHLKHHLRAWSCHTKSPPAADRESIVESNFCLWKTEIAAN